MEVAVSLTGSFGLVLSETSQPLLGIPRIGPAPTPNVGYMRSTVCSALLSTVAPLSRYGCACSVNHHVRFDTGRRGRWTE